jgi:hypothetical protein
MDYILITLDTETNRSAAHRQEVFAALERNLDALAERHGELQLTVPMAFIEGIRK